MSATQTSARSRSSRVQSPRRSRWAWVNTKVVYAGDDDIVHVVRPGVGAEIDGDSALAVAQEVDIAAVAVEEEVASGGGPAICHGGDDTELLWGGQGALAAARPCKRPSVSYYFLRTSGVFAASKKRKKEEKREKKRMEYFILTFLFNLFS